MRCCQCPDIAIAAALPPPHKQCCHFLFGNGSGGGGSAVLALLAPLHLQSFCIGRVFRVVRWQGNWWQYWGVGGGALVLGCHWLRVTGDFAAWHWGGRVGRVVLMGRWWWRVGWAGELSRRWCRRASVRGGGTQQSTIGGRWKGGVGSNHCIELGG